MMIVQNNHKWPDCPLCHSRRIKNLGNIDFRKPVMFSTHQIELQEISSVSQCTTCNSWFSQNIVREKDAIMMYQKGESNTKWSRQTGFVEEKHRNIIRRLEKYFLNDKRVLDVGCNTGSLLDFASSKGCYTYGVEPSITSQRIMRDKGHYSYSSIDEVSEKVDVITAFDLVEHLHDLQGFLKKTNNLLVDGGVLILLTGDVNSLSARLSKNNWWYLKAPEHIVFPSRQFLQELDNFQLISIDETYASVGYKKHILWSIALFAIRKVLLNNYQGLPALSPDHMLVTLGKI